MLDRTSDTSPTERRRAQRREQQRRHRERQRHGRRAYVIELNGSIVDLLVKLHWLDERATDDDRRVAHAIELLLADAAS